MLLCLLLLFATLFVVERREKEQLRKQITAASQPIGKQISELRWSILKRKFALEYAKATLKKETPEAPLPRQGVNVNFLQLQLAGQPIGVMRELANIQSAQLKLDRDKNQLKLLEDQLKKILEGQFK